MDACNPSDTVANCDGDGTADGNEPGDSDGDSIPDAEESSINDEDGDGVTDQEDSANNDECIPDNTRAPCDQDGDSVINSSDVDDDNDGLIEVFTLQDLDWMRYDIFGTSRTDPENNSSSEGCPASGCKGYELMADLDFDTNGDGLMDESDTYFDYEGDGSNAGWRPLGFHDEVPEQSVPFFRSNFNGNNHTIRNLYINRPDSTFVGLFGYINEPKQSI